MTYSQTHLDKDKNGYPNHSMKGCFQNSANIFLFVALSIGLFFRLFYLDHQSFWRDEIISMVNAQKPAKEIFFLSENFPPLYNLILHFQLSLGSSEFIARLPSVVFGFGSLILLYILTKKMFDSSVAILSIFLLAINPLHIWYSQEARMYAPWIFFSLGSVYYFYSFVVNREVYCKKNNRDLTFFAIFSLLAIYTNFYSSFIFLFQSLYLLFHKAKRQTLIEFGIVMGIVFLIFFPYLIIYINNLVSCGHLFDIGTEKEFSILFIFYTLFCYSLGTSYGPSVAELHFNRSIDLFLSYPFFSLVIVLFGSLFLSGLLYIRKKNNFVFHSLYFLVPIISPFLVNLVSNSISFNVRYTLTALPPYIIILACGLKNIWTWTYPGAPPLLGSIKKYTPLTLLVFFSLYSLYNHYLNPKYYKVDIRNAALFIEKNESPGDKLFIYFPSSLEFKYYYQGNNELVRKLNGKNIWVILMREWEYPRLLWDDLYREKMYMELPGVKIYKLVKAQKD